jgi:hypothetical protein
LEGAASTCLRLPQTTYRFLCVIEKNASTALAAVGAFFSRGAIRPVGESGE